MSDTQSSADRMRAVGLFELQPTLAGLLTELAQFLTRHRINAPLHTAWRRDPSRGWLLDLELDPGDLLRVFVDWPVPVTLEVEAPGTLILRTETRVASIFARQPLSAAHGEIVSGGLLIRPGAPLPSANGAARARTELHRG